MQSEMMNRPMFRSPQGAPQGGPPMPPAGGLPMQKNPEAGIAALTQGLQSQTKAGLASAANPEEAINAMRGNRLPLQARYAELAQIVGPEDAQATPPMVLTLVQPALMLGEGGSGIEGLMPGVAGEPPAPGGIGELMPQARPAPQMAPSPQEFSRGGYVRGYAGGGYVGGGYAGGGYVGGGYAGGGYVGGGYADGGGVKGGVNVDALLAGQGLPMRGLPGFQRGAPPTVSQQQALPYATPSRAGSAANLQQYYDEEYSAYMDILAPTEEEKKASKRDLWFDVARRGLAMAAGTNPDTGAQVKGNTASRFADAFGTLPTTISANRREMETGAQNRARQAAAQSASSRLAGERQAAYEADLKGSTRAPAMYEVWDPSGTMVFTGNYEDPNDQARFAQYQGRPGYRFYEVGEYKDPSSSTRSMGGFQVVGLDNRPTGPTFPETQQGFADANAYLAEIGGQGTVQKTPVWDPTNPDDGSGGTTKFMEINTPSGKQVFDQNNPEELKLYREALNIPGAFDSNLPLNTANSTSILAGPNFKPIQDTLAAGIPPTDFELNSWNTLVDSVVVPAPTNALDATGQQIMASSKLTPAQEIATLKAQAAGVGVRVPEYMDPKTLTGKAYIDSQRHLAPLFGSGLTPFLPGSDSSASAVPLVGEDDYQPTTEVGKAILSKSPNSYTGGPLAVADSFMNKIMSVVGLSASAGETEVEETIVAFNRNIIQTMTNALPGKEAQQTLDRYEDILPRPGALTSTNDVLTGQYEKLLAFIKDDLASEATLFDTGAVTQQRAQEIRYNQAEAEKSIDVIMSILQRLKNQRRGPQPATAADLQTIFGSRVGTQPALVE